MLSVRSAIVLLALCGPPLAAEEMEGQVEVKDETTIVSSTELDNRRRGQSDKYHDRYDSGDMSDILYNIMNKKPALLYEILRPSGSHKPSYTGGGHHYRPSHSSSSSSSESASRQRPSRPHKKPSYHYSSSQSRDSRDSSYSDSAEWSSEKPGMVQQLMDKIEYLLGLKKEMILQLMPNKQYQRPNKRPGHRDELSNYSDTSDFSSNDKS